jgi:hypothetical protein
MSVLVFILGRTGTGKSYSMRNFPKDKVALINVQGKILPFRGSAAIKSVDTDDHEKIKENLEKLSKKYKSVVVDDYQYVMSNEFMRRAYEKGWDKFTEIGAHAWEIADKVRELPSDTIVYVMCHTDIDAEGTERLKTIGKMLDEKIYLEGMSTIVLKTHVSDGKYTFLTQNNGKDTVKSPADMFPSYAIDNDLWYVDQKIREYYGMPGIELSNEELAEADESAAHEEIEKDAKKSRRRKTEKEEPKRRKRSDDPEVKAVMEKNSLAIAEAGVSENAEEIPFGGISMPEIEELPKRKRRRVTDSEEVAEEVEKVSEVVESAEAVEIDEEAAEDVPSVAVDDDTPKRRRRRRTSK